MTTSWKLQQAFSMMMLLMIGQAMIGSRSFLYISIMGQNCFPSANFLPEETLYLDAVMAFHLSLNGKAQTHLSWITIRTALMTYASLRMSRSLAHPALTIWH